MSSWVRINLNSICDIGTGKWDANHSVINGKFRFYTCAFEHLYCDTKRFKGECLILPGNGANVGEVFYYNSDFDAYQRTYVISNILINSKYLYYHLLCFWRHRNSDKQFGSATNYIRIGNFNNYIVDSPPLPEQKAIVAKIEQLFSDLDNGIANLKKAQKQLKIYRQAVLKKAFEGELTKEWREAQADLPTADELLKQIKEERAKYYQKQIDEWKEAVKEWEANGKECKKPSKPKKQKELSPLAEKELEELPKFPVGWKWVKMDYVTERAKKIIKNKLILENDFFYFDIGGIDNKLKKIVSYKTYKWKNAPSRAKQIIEFEDTLFSTVRTYLKNIALVDKKMYDKQICSTGFTVLRGIKPNIVSRFIYYLSMSERFIQTLNKLQVGTSYPAVKDDDLFNQAFPLCSTEEQHQIVQEIETRLSVCDNVEANIKESLIKAESLRKSILKKAFEGKLLIEAELEEVKNDPEWEPAEKLLARIEQSRNEKIKAEKTKSSKQKRKKR
jgi:type I restriction enzyme S subunit